MRPEPPDVRYARSGDVSIAYATVGEGPLDVVFVRGFAGASSPLGSNRFFVGSSKTSPSSGA
jgi:hypothetical protein